MLKRYNYCSIVLHKFPFKIARSKTFQICRSIRTVIFRRCGTFSTICCIMLRSHSNRLPHHIATGARLNVNTKCCATEISCHRILNGSVNWLSLKIHKLLEQQYFPRVGRTSMLVFLAHSYPHTFTLARIYRLREGKRKKREVFTLIVHCKLAITLHLETR